MFRSDDPRTRRRWDQIDILRVAVVAHVECRPGVELVREEDIGVDVLSFFQAREFRIHQKCFVLQDEPDTFMLQSNFVSGVATLARHNLCYDILVFERQLENVRSLVSKLPEMRLVIDHIAKPDILQWAPGLPKTRSGKIMRRILRKIAENELHNLGDTSTLAEPIVVEHLIENRANRS